MIDVYCLQEVGWRGQGAWMLGMKGRTYKLAPQSGSLEERQSLW